MRTPSAVVLPALLPLLLAVCLPPRAVAQAPAAPTPAAVAEALPDGAPPAMAAIRGVELLADATWLSADERQGRLTGTPGQEAAAEFVAQRFAQLGLEPLGDEQDGGGRSYLQRYPVTRTSLGDDSHLRIGDLEIADGFAVLTGKAGAVGVDGPLVFRGRGRTRGSSAEVAADEDLAGEVPLVLIKSPRGRIDRKLGVEQKMMMAFGAFQQVGRTVKSLQKQGARVVVFAMLDDPLGLVDVLDYVALSPQKPLLKPRFRGADGSMGMMAQMLGGGDGPPTVVLSPAVSRQVLQLLGVDEAAARAFVDQDGERPQAKVAPATQLRIDVAQDDAATACNAVACLRGSDRKLAGEAVVFSAHMDHVGRRMDGAVFHGADDNASGTAGLLGIAKACAESAKAGHGPRRSLVFLSVSGEELGLWGSAYHAEHPTFDGELIADVNTDMIGRSGPEAGDDEVLVTPSPDHRMFSTIVQDAAGFADQLGLRFASGDKYYERSDHYNFARKDIPVVFFCTGEHEDYHQVTDTADKLEPAKMQKVARLAFWTGWRVANADERPATLGRRADWK